MSVVYLASSSPRRRELLQQIGIDPCIVKPDIDESPLAGESPEALVRRLSVGKAEAGAALLEAPGLIVAADTVVVLDGSVMGKPVDQADACRIWSALSGRTHQVMTGVSVSDSRRIETCLSVTEVTFRVIDPEEMRAYWHTGEPADKAGAYGIQGRGAVFVESIRGSYSNVVGLPLTETAAMLAGFGIDIWVGQ